MNWESRNYDGIPGNKQSMETQILTYSREGNLDGCGFSAVVDLNFCVSGTHAGSQSMCLL